MTISSLLIFTPLFGVLSIFGTASSGQQALALADLTTNPFPKKEFS
jgi:hypothetical protein